MLDTFNYDQHNKKTILTTGSLGFIGSHFCEHIYRNTNWNIVIIDKMTYASLGFSRLRASNLIDENNYSDRIKIFTFDLTSTISPGMIREIGEVDYILHFAAETHVDDSIADPVHSIYNNIMSTTHLLEYARKLKSLKLFFYFSTDECFGNSSEGPSNGFTENHKHHCGNPYSASKSGSEQICLAYENTYKVPVIICNVMNGFGERQHSQKFIPKVIKALLNDELVEIHADKDCKNPGKRTYIHARNMANAVMFLIKNGKIGESYNVVGEKELDNLELAQFIAGVVGKELKYKLVNFHESRPGHDLQYKLDGTKMKEMGWELPLNFEESMTKTIKWTLENPEWLES